MKKKWPLICALAIYFLIIANWLVSSISKNDGHLVYTQDDTYIHMAIAKNFVHNHMWSANGYGFTSTTSSPLWTFLLALTYFLFGVNNLSPLVLNIVMSALLILAAFFFIKKYLDNRILLFGALLLVIFATPLPTLTLSGMEHLLHSLLTLIFFNFSISYLSASQKRFQSEYKILAVLAPLLVMARYEGLFLVFAVSILLLVQKRLLESIFLAFIAITPVLIYGIGSILHGWFFLPNPIMINGNFPGLSLTGIKQFVLFTMGNIRACPELFVLLIVPLLILLFSYRRHAHEWDEKKYSILLLISIILLHVGFARIGAYYRYEAYLIILGLTVLATTMKDLGLTGWTQELKKEGLLNFSALLLFVALTLSPFLFRAHFAAATTIQATNNIYTQQYQMALFLKKFYPTRAIALNDIGAVGFISNVKILDLWGLASMDTKKLWKSNQFKPEIFDFAKNLNVKIAIVYESWFEGQNGSFLPSQWIKVGQWTIANNVVCGSDTVTFFAVDSTATEELNTNLKAFSKELPNDVKQEYNLCF